jgi:hypothetical protein
VFAGCIADELGGIGRVFVPTGCFCDWSSRFAVVMTESLDGARAIVRVQVAGAGTSVDQRIEMPVAESEALGNRWLLIDARRLLIDENDQATCGVYKASVQNVMTALTDPATCSARVELSGPDFQCNDVRYCAAAPTALLPLALWLAGLWGRGQGIRRRTAERR